MVWSDEERKDAITALNDCDYADLVSLILLLITKQPPVNEPINDLPIVRREPTNDLN